MKRISFHENAEAELIEAARYYEERAAGLGFAFLEDVDKAVSAVSDHPLSCQLVGREVRHKLLTRFPYSLLYVIEPNHIRVLAIAHHKRRPGYWHHRT